MTIKSFIEAPIPLNLGLPEYQLNVRYQCIVGYVRLDVFIAKYSYNDSNLVHI